MRTVPRCRLAPLVAVLVPIWLLPVSGAAADSSMEIRVLVSRLLEEPGEIDPRARSVHEVLRRELRYGSLELVLSRELRLALDEVGEVRLPNDKRLRVRPLLIDDRGALVAVGVQGSIQTDLRVQSGQLVVIGTERSDRGKLAIALEPRFETPASGPP